MRVKIAVEMTGKNYEIERESPIESTDEAAQQSRVEHLLEGAINDVRRTLYP